MLSILPPAGVRGQARSRWTEQEVHPEELKTDQGKQDIIPLAECKREHQLEVPVGVREQRSYKLSEEMTYGMVSTEGPKSQLWVPEGVRRVKTPAACPAALSCY